MEQWALIFSSASPHEAELVKALLEEHGLHPVLMDQRVSPYPHVGAAEVWVPRDEVLRALYLVRQDHAE